MNGLFNVDIANKFPRPKILTAYSIKPTRDELNVILKLYKWCVETREELGQELDLPSLFEYQILNNKDRKFLYKKDSAQLKLEVENWNAFQTKSGNSSMS